MSDRPRRTRNVAGTLAAEFGIIFVGVVLAFQFESWGDRREGRARETDQLEALAADFAVNQQSLVNTVEAQERSFSALTEWWMATSGRPVSVSMDSLGALYPYAISWYAEEAVSGAWTALLASGDAGLIENRDLRRRLAEFYGWIDTGFEDHQNEMDVLMSLVDLSGDDLGRVIDPLLAGRQGVTSPAGMDTVAVRRLVELPGHLGLLAWKVPLAGNRLSRLQWLLASADTIAQLIDSELATRND